MSKRSNVEDHRAKEATLVAKPTDPWTELALSGQVYCRVHLRWVIAYVISWRMESMFMAIAPITTRYWSAIEVMLVAVHDSKQHVPRDRQSEGHE